MSQRFLKKQQQHSFIKEMCAAWKGWSPEGHQDFMSDDTRITVLENQKLEGDSTKMLSGANGRCFYLVRVQLEFFSHPLDVRIAVIDGGEKVFNL